MDKFVAFMENSINLTNRQGFFSFIVPNTYLRGPYFNNLKQKVLQVCSIHEIVDFQQLSVFADADVFTSLFVFQIGLNLNVNSKFCAVNSLSEFPTNMAVHKLTESALQSLNWAISNRIAGRLIADNVSLNDLAYVKDVGLNYWTKGRGKKRGGSIAHRILYTGDKIYEKDIPFLKGRDLHRYYFEFQQRWLLHNYKEKLNENDTFRYSADFLKRDKKIIYRQTSASLNGTIDSSGFLVDKTLHIIVWKYDKQKISLEYLLGLFNSKLLNFIYADLSQEEGRAFAQVKVFRIKMLPIRTIDFDNSADVARHDSMVSLVDSMLDLHKQLPDLEGIRRDTVQAQIERADAEIDELVYKIYDLTSEEIAIVEGRGS